MISTAYGAQVVADTAKALVVANWSTVCDAAWCKDMGAPNLPAPVAANIFTSQHRLFSAETQPAIALTVTRTDARITDALGAMDQVHDLEVHVTSDWGFYDALGFAQPLVQADVGDPPIPFTIEVYETAMRAYVEGIVMILCSPTFGLINLDARNTATPAYVATGIFNAAPAQGVTPSEFVVGEDETGQTVVQQTVKATIQVFQRRSLAR